MSNRQLVSEFYRLKDRAVWLAEASTGPFEHVGARAHPSSRIPTTAGPSTLDEIGRRVDFVCRGRRLEDLSTRELKDLNEWAQSEIRLVTHGPSRTEETQEEFRWRVCSEYEGKRAQYVADREHLPVRMIWRIRHDDGRDGGRGLKRTGGTAVLLAESGLAL